MTDYLAATVDDDVMPISLCRSFSAITRAWLKDYEPLSERKLLPNAVSKARASVDVDGYVDPYSRTIQLDLHAMRARRQVSAILVDTLCAHEVGGTSYPYGHGAAALNPRTALPLFVGLQDSLNEWVLALAINPQSAKRYYEDHMGAIVTALLSETWFLEMLALLSQSRRLSEQLHANWQVSTKKAIRNERKRLRDLERRKDNYALGLRVWRKLREKFGTQANRILELSRDKVFLFAAIEQTSIEIVRRSALPGSIVLAALDCRKDGDIEAQLRSKLASTARLGDVSIQTRLDHFVEEAVRRSILMQNSGLEFFSALWVGKLWLALNSIIFATTLYRNQVSAQVLIKRDVGDLLKGDKDTINLAVSILSMRSNMADIRVSQTGQWKYPDRIWDYLDGKCSLEQLLSPPRPSRNCLIFHRQDIEYDVDLPQKVKRYYASHRDEINRWLKEPRSYLEQVMPLF